MLQIEAMLEPLVSFHNARASVMQRDKTYDRKARRIKQSDHQHEDALLVVAVRASRTE
jgi:hypothetical protein